MTINAHPEPQQANPRFIFALILTLSTIKVRSTVSQLFICQKKNQGSSFGEGRRETNWHKGLPLSYFTLTENATKCFFCSLFFHPIPIFKQCLHGAMLQLLSTAKLNSCPPIKHWWIPASTFTFHDTMQFMKLKENSLFQLPQHGQKPGWMRQFTPRKGEKTVLEPVNTSDLIMVLVGCHTDCGEFRAGHQRKWMPSRQHLI